MSGGRILIAAAFRLLLQRGEPVGVVDREAHAGGDEHLRMVRLQPGGLVGDQRVGGGVRFVEAVVGELRHQVEDFGGLRRIDAALDRALGEDVALRLHLRGDLLAHGAAQQVGAAEAVAGHRLGDLHHLFLVDHDAVGLGQDVVDDRMRRVPFLAVLAPAVIGDVGHRAGTIQRDGGDQVLEPVGPHLPQRVAHALAFHLEHPAGIAALQHLVGFRVVQRQAVEIDRRCRGPSGNPRRDAGSSAWSGRGSRISPGRPARHASSSIA